MRPTTTAAKAGARLRAARCRAPAFAGVAMLVMAGCTDRPVRTASTVAPAFAAAPQPPAAPMPPAAAQAPAVPAAYQYLYGSGEAGALQLTVFHALIAYTKDRVAHRPADSVVLAAGSPLVKASYVPCGDRPFAAVFDADETVLLNLGFEADEAAHPGRAYDEARWQAWERTGAGAVAAVPGAVHAFDDLRKLGVTVVVNTNRSGANAAATAAALRNAGLGAFVPGDTLYTRAAGEPSGKDARRAAIAARWCVIAMAGDQLGDFSDRFNAPMTVAARRQLAVHSSAAGLWGKGWFVLPNPVYGTALKGGVDDVFPADKRWSPPVEEK